MENTSLTSKQKNELLVKAIQALKKNSRLNKLSLIEEMHNKQQNQKIELER
jgi:hypothetical protein